VKAIVAALRTTPERVLDDYDRLFDLADARAHLAAGATTILNPAPAQALPAELVSLCDVLVANETEFAQLPDTRDAKALIITLGARGCRLMRPNREALALPGHAVKVVDSIGAGDTFVVRGGVEHQAWALEPAVVVDVFTPTRDDYAPVP